MRIFIIRHAEPDYSVDGLTEKGKREAELLAKRLVNEKIDQIYSSPFGRARMTCEATANKRGQSFTICPWLREFNFPLIMPDGESERLLWDRMPAFWTKYPEFFLPDEWMNVPFIKNTELPDRYNDVCNGIDEILKNNGYERNGKYYNAVSPNVKTIALFCHFGTESMILSHLLNIPPMPLLHNTVALPSSLTIIHTEEREKGIASLRLSAFGDTSHLYAGGEKPSFMARFQETFDDPDATSD